jgi:hypothetical protein
MYISLKDEMMMMGGDGIFTNLLLLLTPPTFEMASGKR